MEHFFFGLKKFVPDILSKVNFFLIFSLIGLIAKILDKYVVTPLI